MAQNLLVWDSSLRKMRRSSIVTTDLSSFKEITYSVSGSNVTEFPLSGVADVTPSNIIDVERNGQRLVEGSDQDYTRDPVNDKVVFNYIVPQKSKVHIRVYGG